MILGFLLARKYRPGWVTSQHLQDWQALLTILGIVVAGLWFFFERPDAGKIEIDQDLRVAPIDQRWVRLFITISVTNVGETGLSFDDQPYLLTLSELAVKEKPRVPDPLSEEELARSRSSADRRNRKLMLPIREGLGAVPRANFIGGNYREIPPDAVARTISRSDRGLTIILESKEKEELIFSAHVRCREGLVLYSLFQLEKKYTWYDRVLRMLRWGEARSEWVPAYRSRRILDLAETCGKISTQNAQAPGQAAAGTGGR
ncbi:hypothetical protein [Sandaracinobacteroides hominis]|uniref:hypothetical protein n=1 Tax=Sandaracinobacteroides hominis TaxID=2780086 RepID=UPI0018F3DEB3|nr:hypothetical protein [Sandaracinobacteroides hominis]